ncbi:endonuclease/exonuclease/phosphatase family protein [Streptomyces sp. NPDC088124]|uniref:endonuclease/exonuclease/phosphatase family protein n=1 Tax=Streptomyces sp. NPDC088124 TaxID=3154654 RepID=UPI0034380F67
MKRLANLNAYKLNGAARGTSGWQDRVDTVREIGPDILAVQEIRVDENATPQTQWDARAAQIIKEFADECGLTGAVGITPRHPHGIAMAANAHRAWYTALLWNPGTIGVVPGSYRPFGSPDFWHGFTTAQFEIGAEKPVTIGSYHGDPFRPNFREDEALRIKGILRSSGGANPGFVLGDFNALSAARVLAADGTLYYYDPEPYTYQDHDDLEYQLLEGTIGGEQLADRRQTDALLRRGFTVDAAAHLGAPWHPTVGHWPDGKGDPDPWGERRIDLILATRPAAPSLVHYGVHRTPAALRASDHLSPYVDINPNQIL